MPFVGFIYFARRKQPSPNLRCEFPHFKVVPCNEVKDNWYEDFSRESIGELWETAIPADYTKKGSRPFDRRIRLANPVNNL